MMTKKEFDILFIKKTFELAKKGQYSAHPNPKVGAIVVKNNKIISKGYHKSPGSPHAEKIAITNAGNEIINSTLYVNLEPCCHYGKTPPCLDLIIKNKIKRVVISTRDPNPLVNGKSIKALKKSGIEVSVGICKKEAISLNRGFFKKFKENKPFVILKSGISLDGKISLKNGNSKWITSAKSRDDVQYERALCSLILTTSKTVIKDDPELTVRKKELLRKNIVQPDIALLDSKLIVPLNSKVFDKLNRKIYIFSTHERIKSTKKKYKSNVLLIPISLKNNQLNLKQVFDKLVAKDINNILVESGSTLACNLFKASLVDELLLYISPKILGNSSISFSGIDYIKSLSKKINFKISDIMQLDNDIKIRLLS